ncbi:MAG: hypothetical protein ACJ8GW_09580 [Massilia sp.]
MTYLIHVLAATSLLAGCASSPSAAPASSPVKESSMNASVTIAPEQTVPATPTSTLRYDGVEDSRCPPNVQCIRAGELAYKFTLTSSNNKEMFGLTAAKPSFASAAVAGLQVALGTNPVPKVQPADAPAKAAPLPVTVTITHN